MEGKRSSESGSKPPANQDAKPNRHWQPYRMSVCVFWNGRLPRQISIWLFFPTQRQAAHTFTLTNHCLDWWSMCIYWLIICSRFSELYCIMGIDNLHFYMGKRFRIQHWHTLHMLWFQTPDSLSLRDEKQMRAGENGERKEERETGRDKGREFRAGFRKQTVTPGWKESTIPFNDNHVSRSLLWSEEETHQCWPKPKPSKLPN